MDGIDNFSGTLHPIDRSSRRRNLSTYDIFNNVPLLSVVFLQVFGPIESFPSSSFTVVVGIEIFRFWTFKISFDSPSKCNTCTL